MSELIGLIAKTGELSLQLSVPREVWDKIPQKSKPYVLHRMILTLIDAADGKTVFQ